MLSDQVVVELVDSGPTGNLKVETIVFPHRPVVCVVYTSKRKESRVSQSFWPNDWKDGASSLTDTGKAVRGAGLGVRYGVGFGHV